MADNMFTPIFNAQRTAIEQGQALSHDMIEAQRSSFGAISGMMEASESVIEQNAELTKGSIHAYLDAVESTFPDETTDFGQLREMVDEHIDSSTEAQMQTLETMVEAIDETGRAYDEVADTYAEMVDSSFDAYLDAHEQVDRTVSSATDMAEEAMEEAP
ncbi:MAG: hypothetical protein U5K37_04595 [Natrialbaceae archaeon]|nr:hypothetical protein [Natrialbaceae archaeon]